MHGGRDRDEGGVGETRRQRTGGGGVLERRVGDVLRDVERDEQGAAQGDLERVGGFRARFRQHRSAKDEGEDDFHRDDADEGGAGGGGAGGVGSNANPGTIYADDTGGKGGNGLAVAITGSSVTYAGGGNGSIDTTQPTGGGGYHGTSTSSIGQRDGTANLGAGGRGGSNPGTTYTEYGGGGSGVVILRVPTVSYSNSTTGNPTVSTSGSDTIMVFTGSGSYKG